MSPEVCPFCGKLFKRLKSHLPHCKAAALSKTPPIKDDVTVSQKKTSLISPSSSQPFSLENITEKSKKLTPPSSSTTATRVKKSTLASSSVATPPPSRSSPQPTAPTPSKNDTATSSSSSSPPLSLCPSTPSSTGSVSPPTPKKKKKQKLADQMATLYSSSSDPLTSPPLAPSPSLSKPKKKSLRALIEANRSNQVPERASEGTISTSVAPMSVSTPPSPKTESVTSRASAPTGSHMGPGTDNSKITPVSEDPKSEGAPRKKVSSKGKAGSSLSITKASTVSQDFEGLGGGNGTRPNGTVNFLEDGDLSGKERLRGSGSGHQARQVTLQDVKATLGRSNTSNRNGKPSILDRIQMTPIQAPDSLPRTTKTRGPLTVNLNQTALPTQNRNEHVAGLSGQSANTQATELSMAKTEKMKSKQASLFPLQNEGDPSSAPLKNMVRLEEGPNVGYHKVGLISALPSVAKLMEGGALPSISSSSPLPRPQPLPLSNLQVGVGTVRANERLMLEKPQLEIRKPNTAEQGIGGILTDRSLGQVRLRELPEWLALKTPSHTREAVELLQGGWQWYRRKYIDVKKGGIGGVAMLLTGYCVLSYIWCYPHIKRDCWRKYH